MKQHKHKYLERLPSFPLLNIADPDREGSQLIKLILHKGRGDKEKSTGIPNIAEASFQNEAFFLLCIRKKTEDDSIGISIIKHYFETNFSQLVFSGLITALCFGLNSFPLHSLVSPHPGDKGSQVQGHTSVRQQS